VLGESGNPALSDAGVLNDCRHLIGDVNELVGRRGANLQRLGPERQAADAPNPRPGLRIGTVQQPEDRIRLANLRSAPRAWRQMRLGVARPHAAPGTLRVLLQDRRAGAPSALSRGTTYGWCAPCRSSRCSRPDVPWSA
jgi:hypothetical protein